MAGFDAARAEAIGRANATVKLGNQVARLLRACRTESGLSQAAMALKLGVSQPRIAQIESGKPGNLPSIEQIADYAFHCRREIIVVEGPHEVQVAPQTEGASPASAQQTAKGAAQAVASWDD